MKRPSVKTIGRPKRSYLGGIQSSREASTQLVRLEFDLARLDAGIAQSESRIAIYKRERNACRIQKSRLLKVISDNEEFGDDGA